jgi:hypothetical protein
MKPFIRPIHGLVFAAALVALAGIPGRSVSAREVPAVAGTKTIWVTATNKDGVVTDLQAADFEVKVGGKALEVVSAAPAAIPLRVAILDADQGTGAFQAGIAKFMQTLLGHAEFSLTSVVVQPEKIVDYSHDGAELSTALRKLGPRGRQNGAQLIEAIQEATTIVQHEDRRPVILVVRLGGEGASQTSGNQVRESLRKSGAALYVLSAAGAQGAAPSQARAGLSAEQAQMADSELSESATNLGIVLGDGSKESGGRHDQVVSTGHAAALQQLAQELLHQYEVKCSIADGIKPTDKVTVTSKRKGVTLRAPTRLPD